MSWESSVGHHNAKGVVPLRFLSNFGKKKWEENKTKYD